MRNTSPEAEQKLNDFKADLQRQVARDDLSATAALRAFPGPVKKACENLPRSWAHNFIYRYGWSRPKLNTKGVFLDMNHPLVVQARATFFDKLNSGIDRRLVLNIDQVWRAGHAGTKYCLRKGRDSVGKKGKKKGRPTNKVHQHVAQARKSITIVTASWGDMTPGPIALHIPQGLVRESAVREFNASHRGRAYALYSETKSHFMTSQTFSELLENLYGDAYKLQRAKHKLDGTSRGMFLTDAWSGFHATSSGEDLARQAFTAQFGVEMPYRNPGRLRFLIFGVVHFSVVDFPMRLQELIRCPFVRQFQQVRRMECEWAAC